MELDTWSDFDHHADSVRMNAFGSSWRTSSSSCMGNHGRCRYPCGWWKRCEVITAVSKAPLCQLPEYMAHYITRVRQAASARFIEIQKGGGHDAERKLV